MPKRIGMIELLVVLTLLLLGAGLFVAIWQKQQAHSRRIACASNLKAIGQSILLYSNDNRNRYPRTRISYDESPIPTWGTPYETDPTLGGVDGADPFIDPAAANAEQKRAIPADNDITASLWLLVRTQDLLPDVFVCPATNQSTWDMGGPANHAGMWTNWKGRDGLKRQLSYSVMNHYVGQQVGNNRHLSKYLGSTSSDMAILADMNPGGPELLSLTRTSPISDLKRALSRNHQNKGQNVLYADGRVEFVTTPFCGYQRENIFTANGPELPRTGANATYHSGPADYVDSILLPTSADLEK